MCESGEREELERQGAAAVPIQSRLTAAEVGVEDMESLS
jgi:hypothetical protein